MKLLPALFLIGQLCSASSPAQEKPADAFPAEQELLNKIRHNHVDPNAVYHVRDLPLVREDVRFYFTDGILALLEPVEGRVTGAVFVGEGETLVMPPDPSEKRHLARFAGAPVLNEKFNAAFFRFGDDSGAQLTEGIKQHTAKVPLDKQEFLDQWSAVVQNLSLVYDLRLLDDLLVTPGPKGDNDRGFFLAHLFGVKLGAFDIAVDPLGAEQVTVAQINWNEGRRYDDIWLSFPSASARQRRHAKDPNASPLDGAALPEQIDVRSYKVDSTINAERQMEVTATVDYDGAQPGERMLAFHISRFLRVSQVEMDGVKLLAYQDEGLSPEDALHGNDQITVLLPKPIERGRHYSLTFKYAGSVIGDAGNGVLYVGARGIWYPQRGFRSAMYDLTFRVPRKLTLVATGQRVSETEDGDSRVSHWKSPTPIRVAGFNIGNYSESSVKSASGVTVMVYANRGLEPALEGNRAAAPRPPLGPPTNPIRRRDPIVPPDASRGTPDSDDEAANMARNLAPVMDYFSRTFGSLPLESLRVSPIPGKFGQGWPGLIYLSTLSYLPADDPAMPAKERIGVFFRWLLPVHEIAHQWWGHAVIPATYRDEWISEALASYSALLWLEQKDKSGARDVRDMLEVYRRELLEKRNDETVESAGPLAMGFRLDNSRTPLGVDRVFYDKGPWVIHMMRQLMRDPKTGSDAPFFQFLHALREEYAAKPLTTAGFRELAERYVSPALNAEPGNKGRSLQWFFEQWIYGSGIPDLKVEAKIDARSAAPAGGKTPARRVPPAAASAAGKISGTATLTGVEESWIVPVPIYVQTARGESVFAGIALAAVPGGADDPHFSLPLPPGGQKIVVDPGQAVLAVFK